MPYIKQEDRYTLRDLTSCINDTTLASPGELNYIITMLCRKYYNNIKRSNYQGINDIVGALEGAKLEFYRRVASPYEDVKNKINGDVYD